MLIVFFNFLQGSFNFMSYISGFQTDGSYIDLGSDVIAQLSKLIFSSDAKETPISCNAIFSKIRITEESGTVIGIKINSESISKCVNDFLNCLTSQDCSFSGSDATFLSTTMACKDFLDN